MIRNVSRTKSTWQSLRVTFHSLCLFLTSYWGLWRSSQPGAGFAYSLLLTAALMLFSPAVLRAQSTERLPNARVGEPYEIGISAVGPAQSLRWSVSPVNALAPGIATPLPPGLELVADTGVLRGVPTTAQEAPYVFAVEVRLSGARASDPPLFKQTFSLVVHGPIRGFMVSIPERPREEVRGDCSSSGPLDVESNSDELSIAVRNSYNYIPGETIDIKNKKTPITNPTRLIAETIGRCQAESPWQHDDYVIVHLVKWPDSDPPAQSGNTVKYEVEKEKWYLYRNVSEKGPADFQPETVQEATRIYGKRRVAVLLVHLTARDSWDIKYAVNVEKKTPAPIQNVIDLAGIILGGAKRTAPEQSEKQPSYWGGRLLVLADIPSDITVQSNIAFLPSRQMLAEKGAEDEDKPTQQPKNYSKVYDNEGRYHWDVSAGIPLKGFKEVTYSVENGQVTAKEITRQNAYGFLNLFLNPKGVDTKGEEFIKTPHLVLGVPISGKPLDRPFAGLGMGFYKPKVKFNLFAGVVFNRIREPQTLANGQTASEAQLQSDLQTRWVRKFLFGINLPIKQFKDALTKQ